MRPAAQIQQGLFGYVYRHASPTMPTVSTWEFAAVREKSAAIALIVAFKTR
jgi:hypothetical protein